MITTWTYVYINMYWNTWKHTIFIIKVYKKNKVLVAVGYIHFISSIRKLGKLVRNDMYVNEHERLFNVTLRHKIK